MIAQSSYSSLVIQSTGRLGLGMEIVVWASGFWLPPPNFPLFHPTPGNYLQQVVLQQQYLLLPSSISCTSLTRDKDGRLSKASLGSHCMITYENTSCMSKDTHRVIEQEYNPQCMHISSYSFSSIYNNKLIYSTIKVKVFTIKLKVDSDIITNLLAFGSSFITSHTGQKFTFDDLKRATPSVLSWNEMWVGWDKKAECLRYSLPSHTSWMTVWLFLWENLDCRSFHVSPSANKVYVREKCFALSMIHITNWECILQVISEKKWRYYGWLYYLATTESTDCTPSIILFNCCSSGIMTKRAGLAVLHPWRWHESWSDRRSCWQHEQYHCSCVLASGKMLMKIFSADWQTLDIVLLEKDERLSDGVAPQMP